MRRFARIGTLVMTSAAFLGCAADEGPPTAPTNAAKSTGVEKTKIEKVKIGQKKGETLPLSEP